MYLVLHFKAINLFSFHLNVYLICTEQIIQRFELSQLSIFSSMACVFVS